MSVKTSCVAILCKQMDRFGITLPFVESKVECVSHRSPPLVDHVSQSVDDDEEVS